MTRVMKTRTYIRKMMTSIAKEVKKPVIARMEEPWLGDKSALLDSYLLRNMSSMT